MKSPDERQDMTSQNYDFSDRKHTSVEKLLAIITARETTDFDWLKDILDETLEQYVKREFTDTVANIDAYNPLQVEMHLAEGSRLLDLCLNQRKEIYQLESQAINSALDICLSQQTLDFDHELAKIHLAASVMQAQLPPDADDGKTNLQNRHDVFKNALIERLKLHNRSGSALNYGERVRFMRKIYVDNLRLAYQRLNAAWRGMAFAYRIKTSEPAYNQTKDNVLDSYVNWMRRAITAVEESDKYERVFDIQLNLARLGIDKGLEEFFRTKSGDYFGRFTLTREDFDWGRVGDDHHYLIPAETAAIRLLGMDVAFVYKSNDSEWVEVGKKLKEKIETNDQSRDQSNFLAFVSNYVRQERELISMQCTFTPPIAVTELGGGMHSWPSGMLRIESVPVWTEGSSRNHFKPIADPSFQNASPLGEWNYMINGIASGTSSFNYFGQYPGSPVALDLYRLSPNQEFDLCDIVLFLRVAVRKSSNNKA